MPNQTPTFALPGLMNISRPELDRQRAPIRLPPKHVQDDNWLGIPSVGPVRPGGVQPAYPLDSVRMLFGRHAPVSDYCELELSSTEGGIVIDNPTSWLFHVPSQPLPLPIGSYIWELHTTDTSGLNAVYYVGSQVVTA